MRLLETVMETMDNGKICNGKEVFIKIRIKDL